MKPITLPNPTPGKHTLRIPLDPQPPEGWKPLVIGKYHPTILRKGQQRPGTAIYGASDCDWGCEAPCTPGETYWVREPLRGVIDTKFADDETMPICGYATGERDHIWNTKKAREPWRWGKRPTIPAEEMPREFSRYTARCLSVALEHGDEWAWVIELEVTPNTRSE